MELLSLLRQVGAMIERIAALIETIIHEMLMLIRDYFEILFIAAIYLGVAWILAQQGLNDALEHWLTGGVLIGAIATLINRFGQARYRGNGDASTEVETTVHQVTKTDHRSKQPPDDSHVDK